MHQELREQVVPIAIGRKRAGRRLVTSDRLISLALITPSVILVAVFVYGFIGRTFYVSLVRWNDLAPDYTFVGWTNYLRLLDTERFQIDLRNTLVFTTTFIAACLVAGLLLAVLLDQRIKFESVFRTIYMFPLAISFIVTGVAWRWLET